MQTNLHLHTRGIITLAYRTKSQPGEFYLDAVGRRRKLSAGAMQDIRMSYYNGESTRELAKSYRVSISLILTIVYSTPRRADLKRLGLPMDERFEGGVIA